MGLALGTLIVVIVVIVVAVVFVAVNSRATGGGGTGPLIPPGATAAPGLLQPCSRSGGTGIGGTGIGGTGIGGTGIGGTGDCQPGLVCDIGNICLKPLGQPCSGISQCVAAATTCSGTCESGPAGGLDQLCPCDPPLVCAPQTGGPNICKRGQGQLCGGNSECLSNDCTNGVCAGALLNGAACVGNNNCGSNNCSGGFCQQSGVITGQPGAICFQGGNPGCVAPFACIDNTCQSTIGNVGGNCESAPCNVPLVCTNGAQGVRVCTYRPNNECSFLCASGYACSNGSCLGLPLAACASAAPRCLPGTSCLPAKVMRVWNGSTFALHSAPPQGETYLRVVAYCDEVYLLSTNGVWQYISGSWTQIIFANIFTSPILDFTVNAAGELILLIQTDQPNQIAGVYIRKSFGSVPYVPGTTGSQGVLGGVNMGSTACLGGTPGATGPISDPPIIQGKINFIDVDARGAVINSDFSNDPNFIYYNGVYTNFNGIKPRAYGQPPNANFIFIPVTGGVTERAFAVGDLFDTNTLQPFRFPLSTDYVGVTDLFAQVNYITPTDQDGNPLPRALDGSRSFVWTIARKGDGSFRAVLTSATFETELPVYVDADTLIGGTQNLVYLLTTGACF